MHTLNLYYSIQNGGDGSASPRFMESAELTYWDQEHMDEGWGEPCDGVITLTSESPITVERIDIMTKERYLISNYIEGYHARNSEAKEFIEEFFPDGLPEFEVIEEDEIIRGEYKYNIIKIEGKEVARLFRRDIHSGSVLQNKFNNYLSTLEDDEIDEDY